MADKPIHHTKLQQFVEAALTNPLHPVYRLGLTHSPMLQHYAFNVSLLASIKPEDWFTQYPKYTELLTEVMRLCEEEQKTETPPDEIAALKAKIAELEKKIAAPPPAPEILSQPKDADDASDSR